MQSSSRPSTSRTITLTSAEAQNNPINNSNPRQADNNQIIIRLNKSKKKVNWKEDTVDNEHLNKKSSKCCCIYEKPHKYDESSSDSEDEDCDNCRGHVEKKTQSKKQENLCS